MRPPSRAMCATRAATRSTSRSSTRSRAARADAAHFLADVAGVPVHLMNIVAHGHRVAAPARLARAKAAASCTRCCAPRSSGCRGSRSWTRSRSQPGKQTRSPSTRRPARSGGAVVLATGGFAANRELLAEFIPEVARGAAHRRRPERWLRHRLGPRARRGGGADVGLPGTGPRQPRYRYPARHVAALAGRNPRESRRPAFPARERRAFRAGGDRPRTAGGVALEVFDQRIHDIAMRQGPYGEAWKAGAVMTGLPTGFEDSFPELGRPLYSAWVTGALAHTQGGLAVDAQRARAAAGRQRDRRTRMPRVERQPDSPGAAATVTCRATASRSPSRSASLLAKGSRS